MRQLHTLSELEMRADRQVQRLSAQIAGATKNVKQAYHLGLSLERRKELGNLLQSLKTARTCLIKELNARSQG